MSSSVWDYDIPNIWKVIKFHGSSHHQPVYVYLTKFQGINPERLLDTEFQTGSNVVNVNKQAIEHGHRKIVDLPSYKMVDLSSSFFVTFTRPGMW
jgi:hypothetical protein